MAAVFINNIDVKIGQLWRPVGCRRGVETKKRKKKAIYSDISHIRRDHPRRPIALLFGS